MTWTALIIAALVATAAPVDKLPAGRYDHLLTKAQMVAARKAARGLSDNVTGGVASIAILPIEGDRRGVMRRQLVVAASQAGLTVVVRDNLDLIKAEREFIKKHEDLFEKDGPKAGSRAMTADAVVYGSVSELGLLNGQGHCRLTLTAADLETAAVIWGESVTGTSGESVPGAESVLPSAPTLPLWSFMAQLIPWKWVGAGSLVVLGLVLMALARRRRGRVRREALARRLIAACTGAGEPIPRLLDRARASLRRAQLALSEGGQVDAAALVLDERVRLERLRRTVQPATGGFDAAMLFGGSSAAPAVDAPTAEDAAEDVVAQAGRVEASVEQGVQELNPLLVALRRACRRLANLIAASRV